MSEHRDSVSYLRSNKAELIQFMKELGISGNEAELAINKCLRRIALGGGVGYYAGSAVAIFLSVNTAGVALGLGTGIAVAGSALGSFHAMNKSQTCERVRSVIKEWNIVSSGF